MNRAVVGLVAAFVTATGVCVLALGDRHRRGVRRLSVARLLALGAALAPAAWVAMHGTAAFLIWLGSSSVLSWLATLAVNARRRRLPD
jgi:hypothetical protein